MTKNNVCVLCDLIISYVLYVSITLMCSCSSLFNTFIHMQVQERGHSLHKGEAIIYITTLSPCLSLGRSILNFFLVMAFLLVEEFAEFE